MAEERKCYGGQWKIPITPYNRRLYWPPSWIQCDCGELAKQVYVRKGDFLYPNGHYLCKACQREYQKVDGRDHFILVQQNEI
ncbi:hypothetical protein [Enterococcus sp. AZ012]|uniref:hypothetical protein n=1 Tax=unclassified Enterococcus TaxID=2608891 RepID=UPI003D2B8DBE